ncbi:hypothetical protein HMPREF1210_00589 [Paenisporosarcina sp. HGH0030]|uniref:hypothetical protein n=1 Tax=Paenisporosarcina sp. HGH0030 TaxID=1078085 RepID=UPI00034E85C1|nr:hypothetical protein [Paenisporosarcina sp. HGH0030]EPD53766.1 hypothetical protein HMPREF1210_00589 [Paenisporosarcina sp. HGH0030]
MSLTNYLGCNFTLPISDEEIEDLIIVGNNFSSKYERENVRKHITTKHIYEVATAERIGLSLYKEDKKNSPHNYQKKQQYLKALLEILDSHLEQGDYCELYTCWVGEESEERNKELDQTIQISMFDMDDIEVAEKTLLTIKK